MAKERNSGVSVYGNVEFACDDDQTREPISFLTPNSKLAIPPLQNGLQEDIELSFRTTEEVSFILGSLDATVAYIAKILQTTPK